MLVIDYRTAVSMWRNLTDNQVIGRLITIGSVPVLLIGGAVAHLTTPRPVPPISVIATPPSIITVAPPTRVETVTVTMTRPRHAAPESTSPPVTLEETSAPVTSEPTPDEPTPMTLPPTPEPTTTAPTPTPTPSPTPDRFPLDPTPIYDGLVEEYVGADPSWGLETTSNAP
jgi:hypothetical protein